MRAILTSIVLTLIALPSFAEDTKDPYAAFAPLVQNMEEVNKIRSFRASDNQRIIDDRIILMGKEYLILTKRKIRSGEFLKIERMGGSIYPSDLKLCDRHIGCLPFQFKMYKFEQPVKEVRKQIKELSENNESGNS